MPACSIGRTHQRHPPFTFQLSPKYLPKMPELRYPARLIRRTAEAFESIGRLLALVGNLEPGLLRFQDLDQCDSWSRQSLFSPWRPSAFELLQSLAAAFPFSTLSTRGLSLRRCSISILTLGVDKRMAKASTGVMDLTSDSETVPKAEVKIEVKPDPDAGFLSSTSVAGSAPLIRIKKEEEEQGGDYGKIDQSLPEAPEEDNMFEDVDEDEYVDLTYEGIAHVNGVRHFVCEGFKIRQIPEPFIVKRSLLHLFRTFSRQHPSLSGAHYARMYRKQGNSFRS